MSTSSAGAVPSMRINRDLRIINDGAEVLHFIDQLDFDSKLRCPDLLLLDLHLPKHGGDEILKASSRERTLRADARCGAHVFRLADRRATGREKRRATLFQEAFHTEPVSGPGSDRQGCYPPYRPPLARRRSIRRFTPGSEHWCRSVVTGPGTQAGKSGFASSPSGGGGAGTDLPIQNIFDGISEAISLLDHDWNYIYANAQAELLAGMNKEQLIGKSVWDLFPGALGTEFEVAARRAMAEQKQITFEYYFPNFGRWYEHRLYPTPQGLLFFTTDIDERKRLDQLVREGEQRYKHLFDVTREGIRGRRRRPLCRCE